jgi:hypothetical protein
MFPPALARGVCYHFSADSPCNDGPLPRSQRFTLSVLSKNSEIAGFKFATIGVIYAVILAFAIVSVWEKFNEAELRVLEESGAAATRFRLASGGEADAIATRAALQHYLSSVVDDEWLRMARGGESSDATRALEALYVACVRFVADKRPAIDVEAMKELGAITEARRGRLHLATGAVPPALWIMLLCGALVTIGFTYFFGMENLRAQSVMMGLSPSSFYSDYSRSCPTIIHLAETFPSIGIRYTY